MVQNEGQQVQPTCRKMCFTFFDAIHEKAFMHNILLLRFFLIITIMQVFFFFYFITTTPAPHSKFPTPLSHLVLHRVLLCFGEISAGNCESFTSCSHNGLWDYAKRRASAAPLHRPASTTPFGAHRKGDGGLSMKMSLQLHKRVS